MSKPVIQKLSVAAKRMSKKSAQERKGADSPSQLIDARIKELNDWRGETLARVIKQADPEMVEEWKRNRVRGHRNLGLKSVRDLHASRSEPRHPDRLYGVLRIPCAQPAHDPHRHCLCHVGQSRHRLDRLGWMVLAPADAGRSGTG
jgi:hypothetical protein